MEELSLAQILNITKNLKIKVHSFVSKEHLIKTIKCHKNFKQSIYFNNIYNIYNINTINKYINNNINKLPNIIKNILLKNNKNNQYDFFKLLNNKNINDKSGFIYGFTINSDINTKTNFWIKIGRTTRINPLDRINEWNGNIYFCQKTHYNIKLEKLTHLLFKYKNIIRKNKNKNEIEWFYFDKYINITKVISILNEIIDDNNSDDDDNSDDNNSDDDDDNNSDDDDNNSDDDDNNSDDDDNNSDDDDNNSDDDDNNSDNNNNSDDDNNSDNNNNSDDDNNSDNNNNSDDDNNSDNNNNSDDDNNSDGNNVILDNIEYIIYPQNNGELLLKPKTITLSDINNLKEYNFYNSTIIHCKINKKTIDKNKYKSILYYIYTIINCGTKIIKITSLNIKTKKIIDKCFYYLKDIGISIQRVNSNQCIYEIFNQCLQNNIILDIKIKLNDNKLINIII
jgi:hypothetical protein